MEHRREFIENFENCKQIDELLDITNTQKRPQAPTQIFVGLESEKSGNQIPHFENCEKYFKIAHTKIGQTGCDTFPNEFMRFRFEAKPIWGELKNFANMQSSFKSGSDLLCRK